VQFSKAGLDVPEELSLFKKNGDMKVPATVMLWSKFAHQSLLSQHQLWILVENVIMK